MRSTSWRVGIAATVAQRHEQQAPEGGLRDAGDCGSARPPGELRAAAGDQASDALARLRRPDAVALCAGYDGQVEVSPALISNVTEAVIDEVREWQSRPVMGSDATETAA